MASEGYPVAYEKGFPMTIPETIRSQVYVAGAAVKDGQLVTNGGRVLGCTAVAEDLPTAVKKAYALVDQVSFQNAYWRHDIGARALKALEG
jgi:phosphoribosylamine--glycine ligase